MTFLTAKWQQLILVNYKVNPDILKPYIPKGTVLDLYNNACYISLVGFLFKDTRTLGFKLPNHINFEEVNLRFYVTHNNKRGVVFIKEIVPKPLITFIANTLYKEHYQTCKMSHQCTENNLYKTILYKWKINTKWQSLAVKAALKEQDILPDTEAEFITEHYYGYTKHGHKTYEYEVTHPTWKQYPVLDATVDVDFARTYGPDFSFLNQSKPTSVLLAKGSEISVLKKRRLHQIF
jgi:uncharacterized protein YqjF (DUF2071 family)